VLLILALETELGVPFSPVGDMELLSLRLIRITLAQRSVTLTD
jgi:hypothetical protein